jgi:hypothetical protein
MLVAIFFQVFIATKASANMAQSVILPAIDHLGEAFSKVMF